MRNLLSLSILAGSVCSVLAMQQRYFCDEARAQQMETRVRTHQRTPSVPRTPPGQQILSAPMVEALESAKALLSSLATPPAAPRKSAWPEPDRIMAGGGPAPPQKPSSPARRLYQAEGGPAPSSKPQEPAGTAPVVRARTLPGLPTRCDDTTDWKTVAGGPVQFVPRPVAAKGQTQNRQRHATAGAPLIAYKLANRQTRIIDGKLHAGGFRPNAQQTMSRHQRMLASNCPTFGPWRAQSAGYRPYPMGNSGLPKLRLPTVWNEPTDQVAKRGDDSPRV